MTEQQIQSKIIKKLEKEGYFVVKLTRTNKNGIPDLLAIRNGKARFIEVKTEKGVLSELQKNRLQELRNYGCEVDVWTDYNEDFNYDKANNNQFDF